VKQDAIGLMYLDPSIAGAAGIDMIYDGGREMRLAKWLCGLTVFVLVTTSARAILKKSW
jgi:hypothetical protein